MDRDSLLLIALALLCLAGVVLGAGGVALLKRDRSGQEDEAGKSAPSKDGAEER